MASVLFLYASTGGNTEMAVDKVACLLKEKGHRVQEKRVETENPEKVAPADITVFAAPTYGHGVLQEDMLRFCEGLKEASLKDRRCAVIGLGDPRYEAQYHLESIPIMEAFIKNAGGTLLLPPLGISGTPVRHLSGLIAHWTNELLKLAVSDKRPA